MPVARGSGVSTAVSTGSATASLSKHADWQAGDLVIAAVFVRSSTVTLTVPTGWTLIRQTAGGSSPAMQVNTYRKVLASGETGPWDWGLSASTAWDVIGIRVTGFDTTTPVNTSDGFIASTSSAAQTAPSVTPTVASCLLVGFWMVGNSIVSWAPAAGNPMVEVADINNAGGVQTRLCATC